ncbi:MAG: chromosome segregation SMC family protein, partial [Candidatus Bathyarchaeia archaeon]
RRQIENLKMTLERRIKRKESLEREMKGSERIAELAKEALVRFDAQKNLVKKIKSEELALKSLEEMGSLGVISGIHGRLRNLIKVEDNYVKAIEAAASGWLDSLVVEDLNVAFMCIETLERMRLGRVKIIPVKSISPNNFTNKTANIDGIIGLISSFVVCDECYKPAVKFVLGDTLLALNEDAAIRASKDGFRVVTLNGNLYEAGGGVEGGFYRTPVDLSRFIPSDEALKSLEKAIKALERYLNNKENILSDIEDEISEAQSEIISLSESLAKIDGEIERVKKSVSQVETQIRHIESSIEILTREVEGRREQIARFELRLNEICGEEESLKGEYERIKDEMGLLSFHDTDGRCTALAQEIIDLKRKYGSIESELLATRMRVERVLKRNLEDLTAQLNDVSAQVANIETELEEALKEESEARRKAEELEKIRDNLSIELSAAREKIDAFTSQIDSLDVKISNLDQEYYDCIKSLNDREMRMQSINLQINRFRERLRELGCEEPNELPVDLSIEDIEAWMEAVRDEFKRIGAINQLADSQYLEQASRYKELSIRLNELEMERSAILKFINEIEQKKINIFMDAFNKINERINRYFCSLTGGGSALLKLENPENPFGGGVDMIVQFPGKSPILVSGASSGERSVSAVAFLFALQEFSPASFYLFDEIDAHLDAAHVEKLGELLADEASKKNLQFIVISLKPEMVSKADRVYGVYNQNGISHVISMTFKEGKVS